MKNLCSGTQCGGFQFLLTLDLWGIRFHAVIVFGVGKKLLFKSVLGQCVLETLVVTMENTKLWFDRFSPDENSMTIFMLRQLV